jgi:hypothetical protein
MLGSTFEELFCEFLQNQNSAFKRGPAVHRCSFLIELTITMGKEALLDRYWLIGTTGSTGK